MKSKIEKYSLRSFATYFMFGGLILFSSCAKEEAINPDIVTNTGVIYSGVEAIEGPTMSLYFNLVDYQCPNAGSNCSTPVIIDGSTLNDFKDAVDEGAVEVGTFFNTPSNWTGFFGFLNEPEWDAELVKLQSSDYDIELHQNGGIDYYEVSYNGDVFVLQVEEE